MNENLETRLRDAFDAATRTIPDHTRPPALDLPVAHRRRPATWAVAVAAVAVTVAVAVPFVVRGGEQTVPAGPPCPPPASQTRRLDVTPPTTNATEWSSRLPAGGPPRVPFTLTDKAGTGHLHDRGVQVPLTAGFAVEIRGRVGCDWLVARRSLDSDDQVQIGVLRPSGEFRPLGRATSSYSALSPDRAKAAFVTPKSGATARLVVIDIASGKELAATPVSADSGVGGWNSKGIWFAGDDYHSRITVWEPGSRPRDHALTEELHAFFPGTYRMLIQPSDKNGHCVQVVTLADTGRLEPVMRTCGQQREASMSPDGTILLTGDGKAHRIPDGSRTPLDVPMFGSIWEDNRHVLLEETIGMDDATGRKIVVRCNVVSAECERVYDDNRRLELTFAGP